MDKIIHGDSLEVLKSFEDESVGLLCTDPPYGYSFMGKSWDKTLPDIGIFKECLRVLKPGSFAFVMSAPRSDVCARMMLMLEDAGFEIGFTPIYWTYASGFPKAMNIGKMVDKRLGAERGRVPNPVGNLEPWRTNEGRADIQATIPDNDAITPEAKALDGSYGGFQPKPAVEVVIVAMKPLSEKTFVDQALKNGKGITWLDGCRVPTKPERPGTTPATKIKGVFELGMAARAEYDDTRGRFPANLLVSDDVLNGGRERKSGFKNPAKVYASDSDIYGEYAPAASGSFHDSGSYSRYFDLDSWAKTLPFLIVPKASKSEKNAGLDGFDESPKKRQWAQSELSPNDYGSQESSTLHKNHHPTVKPLKLMSYLITLGSRPGDVVLDPFLGSGTTALAAKQLGRKYLGIEREKEYVEIAEARISALSPTLEV